MRHLQAQRIWQRIQMNDAQLKATADSFEARRATYKAKRQQELGGPHDAEFFKCFEQYLEETIARIRGDRVTFENTNSYSRRASHRIPE